VTEMWKMTKFNDRKSRAARRRDRGDIAVQESHVRNWSETRASCLENTNSALCLHTRHLPNVSKFGTISYREL